MTEHDLKVRVLKRLRAFGGYWQKQWGGPYAAAGVADILGCYSGHFIAIELKNPKFTNPKAELTPAQWNYLSQIKANGGFVIVSNDSDDVIQQLTALHLV